MEVGVDLLPTKDAETVFGTGLGRDKFLLFKVTVGVLLVLVAVVAFAFKGQYVLAASEVPSRYQCHQEVLVLLLIMATGHQERCDGC